MSPEAAPGPSPGPSPGPTPERRRFLTRSRLANLVTVSCVLAVLGLGVTIVHFVWPTPLMFALFMTVGQGSFGIAMALYVVVILADLRQRKVL